MRTIALVLLIALAACVRCTAGTTGVLNGYVRDAAGQPAANVRVVAVSLSQTSEAYTHRRGFFVFLTLPPDVYSVHVQTTGYAAYAPGVRINSDQTTFVNFRFNRFPGCPAITRASVADDQRSEQFVSLDVRRMATYPPNIAPPILLPVAPPRVRLFQCL